MELKNKIAPIYGYSVCFVCVIAFFISMSALIGAFFELSDPMHVRVDGDDHQPSLASFDNYKIDVTRAPRDGKDSASPTNIPDETTLRAMYEAARDNKVRTVKLQARRAATASALVIFLCLVLFTAHWTWVRRLGSGALTTAQNRLQTPVSVT